MDTYTLKDFTEMPWKNGGGSTTELFCQKNKANEILFRISQAMVTQDGPFSIFPNIDRILMLVSGQGLELHSNEGQIDLKEINRPVYFPGEKFINCKLIDKGCLDFNVMTNRNFGQSTLNVKTLLPKESISSMSYDSFIYIPSELLLHKMDSGETYTNQQDTPLQIYYIELKLF